VGSGLDYVAEVPGSISTAEGSFDNVAGVTSESGAGVANAYSLQLNTQFFMTTTCSGAANPSQCQGWEQFVFANSPPDAGFAFIQYWLLTYETTCPPGWTSDGIGDCYINSTQAASVPAQTIATLGQLTVTGAAASGGGLDSIVLASGNTLYSAMGNDYFPDLGQNWQSAEFNVFGNGNGSQAAFNTGSTIVVRTSVNGGTTSAPSCVVDGFTAETNNLTLVSTPSVVSGSALPSIVFTESNAGNATPASCSTSAATASYTLSVSESGSGNGTVTSADGEINCGSTCSASYAQGTQVTLTATPNATSTFAGWGGACSGTGSCVVNMNAAQSVTANFSGISFTLNVSETGTGTGQVVSSPAGIKCSASSNQCSSSFGDGTMVTLTASASAGSSFSGWSGDGCSGTKKCDVTVTADSTVKATFAKIPSFMLTVTPGGNGTGTVTSNPSGIDCGSTCTASFKSGTKVTLTAAAASGSTFAGWSGGGCSGIESCAVTLTANISVVPTFVQDSTTNIALAAAVLPLSRSVEVGATATAFATMINAGPGTASTCTIAPATSIPARFVFQTTDPTTNALTGTANTPVDIPQGAAQSFVIAFTPTAAFGPADVAFTFGCANANPAPSTVGVNTLILSASTTPVPDIVALAASGDPGYVDIPGATGTGVFAVATVNLGADATITAAANTGESNLPVTLTLCQTDPTSGACLAAPAATVTTDIPPDATPTFGIFVTGSAPVADMPGVNRIFVTFTDASGTLRGETSVAVRTQ
jgi:hypothetical protein